MLFPAIFISTSEKIGVGLEKQAAIFLISVSPGDGSSSISAFTSFPVQLEGIFSYLDYEILI